MLPRSIPLFLLLAAAVYFGFRHFYHLSARYKWLAVFLCLTLANEVAQRYFAYAYGNNSPIAHFYVVIQCIFYGGIYSIRSTKPILIRTLYLTAGILSISNTLFLQPFFVFPSNAIQLMFALTIVILLFDFRRMIYSEANTPLRQLPDFWLNLGGLIFFSTTFFIFSYLNVSGINTPDWCIYLIYATNLFIYGCYGYTFILARSLK